LPMSFDAQEIVLKAEHVSKRFQLGQFISLTSSLRSLKQFATKPTSLWRGRKPEQAHERFQVIDQAKYLWAVRDVSLEVRRGETVALLGRNGAGKSTLLKLLVGIMQPSEGRIWHHARIVPLLGVGAGFNIELTGRENVFLNAAVLGLRRDEILSRMDAIVEFAENPEFMDTPLKRFSKGMRARLGIAIAINLSPDILIVDEVLTAGDVRFRTKCLEVIKDMCARGMTLLFVSHSPGRVRSLCRRALLMREGRLIEDGPTGQVLQRYLEEDMDMGDSLRAGGDDFDAEPTERQRPHVAKISWPITEAPGNEVVQITGLRVLPKSGSDSAVFETTDPIPLELEYVVHDELHILRPRFNIYSPYGELLFSTIDNGADWKVTIRPPGTYVSRTAIPPNTLGPRTYLLGGGIFTHNPVIKHVVTGDLISFTVRRSKSPDSPRWDFPRQGSSFFEPVFDWETERVEGEMASESELECQDQ
jgi:lipopolysaccharide transport system ATP-binding protein